MLGNERNKKQYENSKKYDEKNEPSLSFAFNSSTIFCPSADTASTEVIISNN